MGFPSVVWWVYCGLYVGLPCIVYGFSIGCMVGLGFCCVVCVFAVVVDWVWW